MRTRAKLSLLTGCVLAVAAGPAAGQLNVWASEPGDLPVSPPRAASPAPVTDDVDGLLQRLVNKQKGLKGRQAAIDQELKQLYARTIVRGRAYVRLRRAGLMPVSGGFEETINHASRIERLQRALERDLGKQRTLEQQRRKLEQELGDLERQRVPLEAQRKALMGAHNAVLAERDRSLAFQRAFQNQSGGHAAVYGSGLGPADPAASSGSFAEMLGKLPFPLPGRAEIVPESRSGGAMGLNMLAVRNTPVRAVFAGRVVFADQYSSYGRTVIVDHGQSYFTVYAHLGEVMVRVGDEVTGGSRLGSVGDGAEGPRLYFELRQGTETVDAREWFGI